ncbi:J domain-containing protein CG6693-like [Formica exsecta]|uniref:J domain-containing protein CG6693-like n=1 Tax=Formica exsecta TaxID=72781 RepID=UPI0011426500|nr:J domain-containing protein CG6693-like [Formica exsecta]
MASLLDLCERYFGVCNFYDVLKIPKSADDKQVKKAYYKLSLLIHPDRVEDSIKIEATEKFKVLGRIYSILSNNEKRKVYDESISIQHNKCDKKIEVVMRKLNNYLKFLLEEISTVKDINNYENLRSLLRNALYLLLLKKRDYDESMQYDESKQNDEFRQYDEFRSYDEEIEDVMRNLTDYLRSLLKEISVVEDINYEKMNLFLLISLRLLHLKGRDLYQQDSNSRSSRK